MSDVSAPEALARASAACDPLCHSEADAAPATRAKVAWALILLLGVLSAFTPVSIDMYLPAFPQIERDLAAPPGTMSYTLSLFLVGLGVGQFVLGPLSDRMGRRGPVIVGCIVFALASIACAMATSVWWMMAARLLMGFSGAAGVVIARAVVRDLFDEKASAGMYSILMLIGGIAPIIGPLAGAAVLRYFDWPMVFWLMTAFGIACAVATLLLLRESLPLERRNRDPLPQLLKRSATIAIDRRFTGYALSMGFAMGAIFAYVAGSPDVFIGVFGIGAGTYSLIFASNSIGLYAGGLLNRLLLRRFNSHQILRVASMFAVTFGLLLLTAAVTGFGGAPVFIGLTFLCISVMGLIFPNAVAAAMAPFSKNAGAASSMLGLTQYAVGALSGAVVGAFHTGTAVPMAAVLAACELCVFISILVGERMRRRELAADYRVGALPLSNAA